MSMDIDEYVRRLTQKALGDQPAPEPNSAETLKAILKGTAIALYCDRIKETVWIVADEADAKVLGEPRGSVYTADEIRAVVAVVDPETVEEVHRWKRTFDAKLSR